MSKKMTFTLLGSGAVRANPKRFGAAGILQVGDEKILFDCGRCIVHSAAASGFPIEDIHHIFITHLHFDHVCDLPYLALLSWNNGRTKPLNVYGPVGIKHFLDHSIHQAYRDDIKTRIGHGKDPAPLDLNIHEISADGIVMQDFGVTISALSTEHAGMLNYNYRVDQEDRRMVFTSDTNPDPALVEFCRGADLLVVECSGTAEFLATQPWGGWHMNPDTVAELAQAAEVKRVVLKHLVIEDFPHGDGMAEKMAAQIRTVFSGEVQAGTDGMRIPI